MEGLLPGAFSLEKDQESGAGATRISLGKIRNPGGWPHHILIFNYIELKGYFFTRNLGGSVQPAFSLENTRSPGRRGVSSQSTCTHPFIFTG